MYSYKLDDIDFNDPIVGIDSISRTILRGWSGTGIENVLRKKTESSLTFTGEAYQYLESKFTDICASTNIKVFASDGSLFIEGTIYAFMCTFNLSRGECETQIKDTSWSSLLVDRANNEMNLRSIKSYDCSINISKLLPESIDFFDINGVYTYTGKRGFDVLKILQKQVEFYTNGQMTLTSSYLTANKYCLFNGKALIPLSPLYYFSISFQKLYEQLRKLLGLYIVIDGTNIILEQENTSFVFDSSTILTIHEIQNDSIIKIDESRQITSVTVGSTTLVNEEDKINSDEFLALDNRWTEQQFSNCTCPSFGDNDLDLVTEFIIDSDTILDTLINGKNGDKFFLIKINDSSPTLAEKTAVIPTDVWFYNNELRNQFQLDNWQRYISSCIYLARGNDATFEAIGSDDPNDLGKANIIIAGSTNCDILLQYPDYISDPFNRFQQEINGTVCNTSPINVPYTSYTVLQESFYAFESARTLAWISDNPGTLSISFLIQVWEDSTQAVLLYQYISNYNATAVTSGGQIAIDMDVTTDALFLSPGNYVVTRFIFITTGMSIGGVLYSGYFRSADAVLACLDNLNPDNAFPYVIEFDKVLCNAEFDYMEENKTGIIELAGNDTYISEVTQDIKGNANFVLISNTPFTKCEQS